MILVEATAVESRGRISPRDLGIYEDRHVEGLSRLVGTCHEFGAKIGIQVGHAGRKAWTEDKAFAPMPPVAPSAIPFDADWNVPHALTLDEIGGIVAAFVAAARRATAANFDVLEIHGAHGYLLSQFLSPLSNRREDEYGGSLENRMRLLLRVAEAVREEWPEERPLFVRVSASDWTPGGMDVDQMVEVARALKERGVDLIHVSSGGVVPIAPKAGPGYQVGFAERIREDAGVATAAVGLITTPELADEIIRNGRADLVALGRELLRDPYWPLHAARSLGVDLDWPVQYRRAKK